MMDGQLAYHAELLMRKNPHDSDGKTEGSAGTIGWSKALLLMTGLNITEITVEQPEF